MSRTTPSKVEHGPDSGVFRVTEDSRLKLEGLMSSFERPLVQGPHLTAELTRLCEGYEIQQGAESLDDLLDIASRVSGSHADLTKELARLTGGTADIPKSLKDIRRLKQKYADYNRVGDVVRSTIHFDNLETLYAAVIELYKRAKIVRVKDRFINPRTSGYRDLFFNLELIDPETGAKHITEVQFQLKAMDKVKRKEYRLYNKRRALQQELDYLRKNEPGQAEKIKDFEVQVSYLQAESQALFEEAWAPYEGILPVSKLTA